MLQDKDQQVLGRLQGEPDQQSQGRKGGQSQGAKKRRPEVERQQAGLEQRTEQVFHA